MISLFNITLSNLMYGSQSCLEVMVLKLTFSKKRLSISFETITTANLLFFKKYQIKKLPCQGRAIYSLF